MLKSLKKSLKGSLSKVSIPCFGIKKKKSQIPEKKAEVERISKPLWQWFEETPNEYGCSEVATCEDFSEEETQEEITQFHSDERDLEVPSSSTVNFSICCSNPPLPTTESCGGSLFHEVSFEVRRASFMIDEDDIEFVFEKDEFYENFQAPKFYDFGNQYVDNVSEAWFCNPECGHFTKAEDILQLESYGESFCKSPEETSPKSVLESCMDDTKDPICSNIKNEDAPIAENREEIEYAIDMIYQDIKQWIYMKEEKALTAAHRKEIEATLEILYQELMVWTDKKEKEARITAHRKEIEDTSETLYQELKVWRDKKEKEARIAAHRKEIEDSTETLYQELKVWTDKKEKEARIVAHRKEIEDTTETLYQELKVWTNKKEKEAQVAAQRKEIEDTSDTLYQELKVWPDKKEKEARIVAHTRKETEDTIEIPYQDIKHHTDLKEDEAVIETHKKGNEGTIERLYQTTNERDRAKLGVWKRKYLTKGVRLVLIRSTLQAIPIYMLSLVVIPKSVIKELEKTVRRSLWGTCNDKMRVLLVSWKKNQTPLENRGLGLRKLGLVNLSLLAKWWHSSLERPIRSSFPLMRKAVISTRNDFPDKAIWKSVQGRTPGSTLQGKSKNGRFSLPRKAVTSKLGNGEIISFWNDLGVGSKPFKEAPLSFALSDTKSGTVIGSLYLFENQYGWNLRFRREADGVELNEVTSLLRLLETVSFTDEADDSLVCGGVEDRLVVKEVYDTLEKAELSINPTTRNDFLDEAIWKSSHDNNQQSLEQVEPVQGRTPVQGKPKNGTLQKNATTRNDFCMFLHSLTQVAERKKKHSVHSSCNEQRMLKSLKKSLKGSLSKLNIPCFGINKKKSQIPEKKAEVERKSKPLWQWFEEESSHEYDCSVVATCEDFNEEKTEQEITQFHSDEKDLEIPSSSTVNFSICCSSSPLPITESCGGSLSLNSSRHATTHRFRYIKGATSSAKSCLDWACSAVSCGDFVQARPISKQQKSRLPRNSIEPTHQITKLRLESSYVDSRNESVVDDIINFSMGSNEATFGENEAGFEVQRASFMIDEEDIELIFEEDEFYENFQAPKFYDFENQSVDNASDAWFCNPECGHFKNADDILQLESDEKSFCKSPEKTSPKSVLRSCLEDINYPTCSNMKKEEAPIAENREEIEYAIDMIYQEIKQWIYMKEEKALTTAHREETEDTLEILYQELKVWTDKKEKQARIAAHRKEIEGMSESLNQVEARIAAHRKEFEDMSESLNQELKAWTDKKEKEARIAAHRKEIEDTSETLYQELKVWTDKKEKETQIAVHRKEIEDTSETLYQELKVCTDKKQKEAQIAVHRKEIEDTSETLYQESKVWTDKIEKEAQIVAHRKEIEYIIEIPYQDIKHHTDMKEDEALIAAHKKETEGTRVILYQTSTENVRAKLGVRKRQCLTKGGRPVLIRLTLQAIPIYMLSLVVIPKGVVKELEKTVQGKSENGRLQKNAMTTGVSLSLNIPCFRINKRKSQIPEKKAEVERKSKPLWQWYEESSHEYDCSEVVTCEDFSEEKTEQEITQFHSDEKDLEIPSSSTVNFSICSSSSPLPTTESCGGSLFLNSSRHATTHRFRCIKGATSSAKSCLDWACSVVSCGDFVQARPISKQQKSRLPRNSIQPTHQITKSRLESPYVDSRNESVVDDIISFSVGSNEATFGENEAGFEVRRASFMIDKDDIEFVFEEDESCENFQAPKFYDFENQSVDNDSEAWFCNPECGHFKNAEESFCKSPEKNSPKSVLWSWLEDIYYPTCSNMKEEEAPIVENREEIEYAIDMIYQEMKQWLYMKEKKALTTAHRKEIEDTLEILYQELKVWTDKKEKVARIAAHRKEIEDRLETLYQELKREDIEGNTGFISSSWDTPSHSSCWQEDEPSESRWKLMQNLMSRAWMTIKFFGVVTKEFCFHKSGTCYNPVLKAYFSYGW